MPSLKLFRQDGDTRREFTADEYAQHEIDSLEEQARLDEANKKTANTQKLVESANTKLASVGLTADEIEAWRSI